jgi:hypothetical protein
MPERSGVPTPVSNPQPLNNLGADTGNRPAPAISTTAYTYAPSAPTGSITAGLHGVNEPSAPLEITNSTQVTLDYEVTRLGPSGVGKLALYLTSDEGRTWQHHHEDLHPRAGTPITVNLPGEGVFGLRLVVTSGAGVARKPPQPGDAPQMRIEVDTTPPIVKLLPPQPDLNRRDALVLSWNASDRNLAPNPIWLQYSEGPDGPWQTIAKELPNSGRYVWQLSPSQPFRVYLRALAFDSAGNWGADRTADPVLIDMNEPEGQLKRVIKPMPK